MRKVGRGWGGVLHRQRHQVKVNGEYHHFLTECGQKIGHRDVTASDLKTECKECLRGILMKREIEMKILVNKLEQE